MISILGTLNPEGDSLMAQTMVSLVYSSISDVIP
jgi:hypothetical protein